MKRKYFLFLEILDQKAAHDLINSLELIIHFTKHFPTIVPENTLDELDDKYILFWQYWKFVA